MVHTASGLQVIILSCLHINGLLGYKILAFNATLIYLSNGRIHIISSLVEGPSLYSHLKNVNLYIRNAFCIYVLL